MVNCDIMVYVYILNEEIICVLQFILVFGGQLILKLGFCVCMGILDIVFSGLGK